MSPTPTTASGERGRGGPVPLRPGSRPRPAPPGFGASCCGLVVPAARLRALCCELSALKAHVSVLKQGEME